MANDTVQNKAIRRWFRMQNKFTIRASVPISGSTVYIVSDIKNKISHLEHFDNLMEAMEWCFELCHDLLFEHEKHWDSTVEVRDFMLSQEKSLVRKLGLPALNQRQKDVLEHMLCVVRDAIESEGFLYGLSTVH